MADNPLVASREDSTEWYTGVGLFESAADVHSGISSGSWIEAGLGVVGVGLEVASAVIDPFGTLAAYGVSWLMEHVQPLSDALDWVAGDPDQVAAYAKTWGNVASKIAEVHKQYADSVSKDVPEWVGAAASAYKNHAGGIGDALAAAAEAAAAAQTAISLAGGVVAAVRETVRDLVAQTVGRLAVWAAEAVFTLGAALPLVAAQASVYVAKTLATISKLFRKLASTMAKLTPLLRKLDGLWDDIAKKLKGKGGTASPSVKGKDTDTSTASTTPSSTTTTPASTDTTPASAKPDTAKPDTAKDPDSPGKQPDSTTPSSTKPGDPGSKPDMSKRTDADQKVGDKARENNPADTQKKVDLTKCGDPVDVASGAFLLPENDIELAGVLPLVVERMHRSNYGFGRWFGPSWSSTLDVRVIADAIGVTFVGVDGELLTYPHPQPGVEVAPSNAAARMLLSRLETGGYRVRDEAAQRSWWFEPVAGLGGVDVALGNYAVTGLSDRHGNRITFSYNENGGPAEVAHSGGYRVRVDTSEGRVTALTVLDTGSGTAGTVVREFGYTAGALTSVTVNGATTRFTYDAAHRMTSWTDARGNRMHTDYDERGRVVSQRGSADIMNQDFDYFEFPDGTGRRTEVTDSTGARTTFVFDADLRLRELIDPGGARTRTEYNAQRRPIRVVAADETVTEYRYDGIDLVGITRPDGLRIGIEYSAPGRPSVLTDVDGSVRRQEWDAGGNLVASVGPAGARTSFTHHGNGAVASITEPSGATTTVEVDGAGLPVRVTDPVGAVTVIERDRFGRIARVVDPLGTATTYQWSVAGKLIRRTDPDGAGEVWAYDGETNLVAHSDRAGNVTRYEYGVFDLLAARTDPDGAVTRYEWDTERRLSAVANPLGQVWHYRYDPTGRLVSETDYSGAATTYGHDPVGRVVSATVATGVTRRHRYDILGRLTEVAADSGDWLQFTYNAAGQQISAVSGYTGTVAHTVLSTYTATGQIESQSVDGRAPMQFGYDTNGRRVSRVDPSGAVTAWEHDPVGRVSAMSVDGRRFGVGHDRAGRATGWQIGTITIDRTWTDTGFVAAQTVSVHPELPARPDTGLQPGSAVQPGRSTGDGPLAAPGAGDSDVTPNAGSGDAGDAAGRVLRRDSYQWRADGYPTEHTTSRPDGTSTRTFALDKVGRVGSITRDGALAERYGYDQLGNIVATEHDPSGRREYRNNLLIRDGRTRYHYDAAGRLVRVERSRLSRPVEVWHYRYNGFDQLSEVFTPDREHWRYAYDAYGRRTTKQRLSSDGGVVERTVYVWDGTRLVEQVTAGEVTAWAYEPGTYRPMSQSSWDADAVDRAFYAIVTDLVGTPVELVDPDAGVSVGAATLDLWGRTTWQGVASPLRFPGQYFDAETGLHYNLFRTYDPATGRYTTNDPLGLAPAPNPNTYPHNPSVWSDPLGLTPCRDYVNTYGADSGGIMASLREDGTLSLIVERGPGTPSGREMFDDVLAHFGRENINAIEAKWVPAMPTNLDRFNELLRDGRSVDDAARATWTGRRAADLGFNNVSVLNLSGSPGSYTNVEVRFD